MIYLGVFYRDNGNVTLQEFLTIEAIRKWWKQNAHHYMTYDIYMAKCINKRIRIEEKYDKYIKNI